MRTGKVQNEPNEEDHLKLCNVKVVLSTGTNLDLVT
jgi:hypothetical protein